MASSERLRERSFFSNSTCKVMSHRDIFTKIAPPSGNTRLGRTWWLVINRRPSLGFGHDSRVARRVHSLFDFAQLIQIGKDLSHRILRSDTTLEDKLLSIRERPERLYETHWRPLHVQQDCCLLSRDSPSIARGSRPKSSKARRSISPSQTHWCLSYGLRN